MRPSSVWLALSHLLLILNLSSCDQDEVCETESCGENELSDVSSLDQATEQAEIFQPCTSLCRGVALFNN